MDQQLHPGAARPRGERSHFCCVDLLVRWHPCVASLWTAREARSARLHSRKNAGVWGGPRCGAPKQSDRAAPSHTRSFLPRQPNLGTSGTWKLGQGSPGRRRGKANGANRGRTAGCCRGRKTLDTQPVPGRSEISARLAGPFRERKPENSGLLTGGLVCFALRFPSDGLPGGGEGEEEQQRVLGPVVRGPASVLPTCRSRAGRARQERLHQHGGRLFARERLSSGLAAPRPGCEPGAKASPARGCLVAVPFNLLFGEPPFVPLKAPCPASVGSRDCASGREGSAPFSGAPIQEPSRAGLRASDAAVPASLRTGPVVSSGTPLLDDSPIKSSEARIRGGGTGPRRHRSP